MLALIRYWSLVRVPSSNLELETNIEFYESFKRVSNIINLTNYIEWIKLFFDNLIDIKYEFFN